MAYIYFDSGYAPCGFLIVKDGGNPYNSEDTVFVKSDWDFPAVASRMGLAPCSECGKTDGTVDCEHYYVAEMICRAEEWIRDNAGEMFESLDDYFDD